MATALKLQEGGRLRISSATGTIMMIVECFFRRYWQGRV